MYFEAVSSLKINFFKSDLIGIKVLADRMVAFAEMIGCKVSKLLSSYLGLPFCLGAASKSLWSPVMKG